MRRKYEIRNTKYEQGSGEARIRFPGPVSYLVFRISYLVLYAIAPTIIVTVRAAIEMMVKTVRIAELFQKVDQWEPP